MSEKYCPDCRSLRPAAEFTHTSRSRDGLAFYCAPCSRARHIASRRPRFGPPKHRGSRRPADVAQGRKWCPECDTIKAREEFPRNRSQPNGLGSYCKPCHNRITRIDKERHGGARNYHLRRRYGITAEHADQMLSEQEGLCAICREAPAARVDHDHDTKRVREMLCFNCNGALGQFRDRTDLMLRAVLYLRRDEPGLLQEVPADQVGFVACGLDSPRPDDEPRFSFPQDEWVDGTAAQDAPPG